LSVADCAEAETGPVEQNRAWSDPQMAKGCMNSLIGSAGAGAGRNLVRKWQFPLKQGKTHLYAKSRKSGAGAITVHWIESGPLDPAWADPTAGAKSQYRRRGGPGSSHIKPSKCPGPENTSSSFLFEIGSGSSAISYRRYYNGNGFADPKTL